MQGAPLSVIIVEVIKHTPAYVWVILAALVALGSLQLRDQVLPRARVLALPIGLGAMLYAARWVQWPRKVEFLPERNAFAVGGSVVPLLAMLAVFAVRYVSTVVLILNPQWRNLASVAIVGGLGYGLLSGVFAMRARTILARGASSLRLSPA
jgi:hypothetical protein